MGNLVNLLQYCAYSLSTSYLLPDFLDNTTVPNEFIENDIFRHALLYTIVM